MTRDGSAGVPGEPGTVHIDRGATVTARMPTAEECARGYPEGTPVMVLKDGSYDKIYPHWVTLQFDDPHGQPDPAAVHDTAAYVLRLIGEQLDLTRGRVTDLADALRWGPCHVAHLADKMREEEEDEGPCEPARQPAAGRRAGRSGPGRSGQRTRGRARRPRRGRAGRRG
jgi:hypothetical protein